MAYHLQTLQPVTALISNSAGSPGATGSPNEEFECDLCDYKTFRKSNMTQHVKTVHDRVKEFGCDRCNYRSARRSNVNYHIKTVHENIKDYACQFCNFKSARKYNVIQHAERVHKAEAGSVLDQKFIHHKVVVQETNPEPGHPPRKRSRKKANTTKNIVTINAVPQGMSQPQPTIIASTAGTNFQLDPPTMVSPTSYASMTLNYAHHQPMYNSPPTLSATQAPQAQNQQQQIQLPTSPVTSFGNSASSIPGVNFSSLQPIHYNQLNQPGFGGAGGVNSSGAVLIKKEAPSKVSKEYVCTFCPYKSSKKKNLSIHLQAIHQANPVPNYSNVHNVAPAAILSTNSSDNIRVVRTGGNHSLTASGKPKNFTCSFCEFRTAYKRNLKAHMNEVHLKERREHKCHICEFKSTRKSNLAQHIKSVHERVKDHHCWLCGFTSTRKRNVEKHVMSMHLQKNQANEIKVKLQAAQ